MGPGVRCHGRGGWHGYPAFRRGRSVRNSGRRACLRQTFSLVEAPQANESFALHLSLKLTGESTVFQDGQPVKLKLTAQGEHSFRERVLAVQKDGRGHQGRAVLRRCPHRHHGRRCRLRNGLSELIGSSSWPSGPRMPCSAIARRDL